MNVMDINGEILAFGIKKRPTLDLVMEPLEETIEIVKNHATHRTTIHSDQGWALPAQPMGENIKEK